MNPTYITTDPPAPEVPAPCHADASQYPWVGDADHDGDRTPDVQRIIDGRARIVVLGGWEDPEVSYPEASYSYNDTALVRLDGDYYALTTSGGSCPSPSETWSIEYGPATLDELRAWCAKDPYADTLLPFLTDEALALFPAA